MTVEFKQENGVDMDRRRKEAADDGGCTHLQRSHDRVKIVVHVVVIP
jgi:hypothetical protein